MPSADEGRPTALTSSDGGTSSRARDVSVTRGACAGCGGIDRALHQAPRVPGTVCCEP